MRSCLPCINIGVRIERTSKTNLISTSLQANAMKNSLNLEEKRQRPRKRTIMNILAVS